jgi:hypothetical protein
MSETKHHINRRDFIAASSVAVAGLAVPVGKAVAATTDASPLPLSVGFWGGAPRIMRRFISTPATFDAAQSVLTADASLFSLGARLSFRGISRVTAQRRSVMIDWMQTGDDGSRVPFFAYTHMEDGTRVRSSTPSSFTIEPATQGTVDLAVRSRIDSGPETDQTVSFAINTAEGALRLNRGVYIFAFGERAPEWRAIRFAEGMKADTFVTGGKPLLASAIDDRPVDFDYVVMTVGAASSPTA